jgi:hypothetical protein
VDHRTGSVRGRMRQPRGSLHAAQTSGDRHRARVRAADLAADLEKPPPPAAERGIVAEADGEVA